eukprot:6483478-Amphidinium_carterae.1
MRDRVLQTFEEVGLQMHEIEGPGLEATVLGADLGGAKGCCRRTAPKLWKLRAALREFVGRGFGSGRQLEVLVGRFIAASLFNRAGLSVLRAVYVFIKKHYMVSVKLWPSVVHELNIMAEIVVLLFSEFLRPWSSLLGATDASTEACGVCVASGDSKVIASAGRGNEKW